MGRFVEGEDRSQSPLLPESLDDYVGEDNPVRVIEAFIDALDLGELGFAGMVPAVTGRPRLSPFLNAQDLSLWLSEPHPIEPSVGARSGT